MKETCVSLQSHNHHPRVYSWGVFFKKPIRENKIGMILLRFAVTMRNHCTPSTHAVFIDHICTRVGVGMFTHPGNMHLPSPVKHCFLKQLPSGMTFFSEGVYEGNITSKFSFLINDKNSDYLYRSC